MNILVVGFGNMGCRHTQSILGNDKSHNIYVVEPSKEIFDKQVLVINSNEKELNYLESLDQIPDQIDFAIVATSAMPRFKIVEKLLNHGVKKMLIEKVAFLSKDQFEVINNLIELNEAQVYCNFVSRYYSNFIAIQNQILENEETFQMTVNGPDFGLGCNGLHYIDLFEYFSNEKATLKSANLIENPVEHKRGKEYKEVLGQIYWETPSGSKLLINADANKSGAREFNIKTNSESHLLNEETLKHIRFGHKEVSEENFKIEYTSQLTYRIFKEIFAGNCKLPTVQETTSSHLQFLTKINETLELNPEAICPIT